MRLFALALLLVSAPAAAQDTLTLPDLQEAAIQSDPRLRQLALEGAATELRLRNIDVKRLPAFRLTGEILRQSEVTEIPIDLPNANVPRPPKSRYEAALGADWLLYDGGVLAARRDVEGAALAARRAELAAEMYPLRREVLDAFFDALLLQERVQEISALIEDLEARLSELRAAVFAGAALPGDTAAVLAEMLTAMQQQEEAATHRRTSLVILEELTGLQFSEGDVLALPDLAEEVAAVRTAAERIDPEATSDAPPRIHPQYAVFAAQRERLEREAEAVRARLSPQLSAFGRYAYGRPGLQQFTRDFHDYWTLGVGFQWAPWDWRASERDVAVVRLQQQIVDTEEEAFAERLGRQVQQPLQEMQRLEGTLELDEQIVALRDQIERQARAQLAERAITVAAYVDARTDLQDARTALLRHRTELARARAEYLTILGVEIR